MTNLPVAPLVALAASAALYLLLIASFTIGFVRGRLRVRARRAAAGASLRVSILKPLAGAEDELAANLRSFADLDHDDYELVFGVSSLHDAAVPVARAFMAAHPHLPARLVVTDPHAALNPKVAQLVRLTEEARGEVLVVSDANVRVPRTYLRDLVAELLEPGVGLVTSVIVGSGERTLGAALENLQLLAHVAPGVVAGATVSGRPISIGKSMAMRAADLATIGGFASVGGVLAEDHVLAQRFDRAGFAVRLSLAPVENRNVDCTVRRSIERHTRWGRMRRFIAPAGFAFETLLSPIVTATVVCLAFPSRAAAVTLLVGMALQVLGASWFALLLRGRVPLWLPPLEVARAYVLFGAWIGAVASRRVSWRGHAFALTTGSRLVPVGPSIVDRLRARLRVVG
jgi:ceramide glucosyltransferase